MLILTRRPGESLYLGDDIRITVLGMQGKQIKLGLQVPAEMTVYREEVYKRVIEENQQAMAASNEDLMVAATLWNKKTQQ
ncbi:MAG: carbon storage regulator CsrA [Desulfovibrio sp.]|nr:carbon storage regulator CsrA [Desulfovibrio sp.]